MRRVSGFEEYHEVYLSTIIQKLNKERMWIRGNIETGQKFEWVMLFGTNMPTYNIGRWASQYFKDVNSLEGQQIIEKHNLTKKEKEGKE